VLYTHVNNVQNHNLSLKKSRLIHGNKKISMQVKKTLDMNDEAGVCINKSCQYIVCEACGFENVSFVEHDVRNYIRKQKGNCARMMMCRTYLTNKYDMLFAPFIGVNHHGQSILLGCGLLSSEDTFTFVWLFQCWRQCMSNKSPDDIITDQCKAMQNTIEIVFPNTSHRWCFWHIMKKIPEKLQWYSQYKGIKCELKKLVYETINVHHFESGWSQFLIKFELQNNELLRILYEDRSWWVLTYLKSNFWAGMWTTQWSEGLNAFFDGFINSTTILHQFVVQYDNALRNKAEKKYEAYFASINTTIPCATHSLIERQFQKCRCQWLCLQLRGAAKVFMGRQLYKQVPQSCL